MGFFRAKIGIGLANFRIVIRRLSSILLSLVLSTSVLAQTEDDKKFLMILSGQDESAPIKTPNVWSKALSEILLHYDLTRASKIEALPDLRVPDGLSETSQKKLEYLYSVYLKFRTESPKSRWFLETRLPELIGDLSKSFEAERDLRPADGSPVQACPPDAGGVEDFVNEATRTGEARVEAIDIAAWKNNWSPRVAAAFIRQKIKDYSFALNAPIVSRESSGMKPPKSDINQWAPNAAIRRIIVHHTVTSNKLTATDIQQMHFDNPTEKYSDVAYHFLIGDDGKIYEGRELKYKGGHSENNNDDSIGITFIRNSQSFDAINNPSGWTDPKDAPPSPEALLAFAQLVHSLETPGAKLHDQLVNQNLRVEFRHIIGHTHTKATDCPGDGCLEAVKAFDDVMMVEPKAAAKEKKKK